jgi:hypothetical protein
MLTKSSSLLNKEKISKSCGAWKWSDIENFKVPARRVVVERERNFSKSRGRHVVTNIWIKLEGCALTTSCMSPCTHQLLQTTNTNLNLVVCFFASFFVCPYFSCFLPTNITTHQIEEQRMKQWPRITAIILMVVLCVTCGNKVTHTTYRMLQ